MNEVELREFELHVKHAHVGVSDARLLVKTVRQRGDRIVELESEVRRLKALLDVRHEDCPIAPDTMEWALGGDKTGNTYQFAAEILRQRQIIGTLINDANPCPRGE